MSRLPVLCTMDVCVELRRSGGSGPDCRNPEVVVAITGRVLHNAPGCSKSCGEEGGWEDPASPGEPRRSELEQRGDKHRGSTSDSGSRSHSHKVALFFSPLRLLFPVNTQHLPFGIGASSTLSSACKNSLLTAY